jgi:hypothetical protein
MLFKFLKTSLTSKGKSGSKSKKEKNSSLTIVESELEAWLYNRNNRYIRPTNESVNESIVNNLSGRDGWDDWEDNKIHTKGAI